MSTFPLHFQPAASAKASPLPVTGIPKAQGLYNPAQEHDACGVGFVAHIKGQKSHAIIEQGLKILENLDHRGAVGADKLMGDGAGILIQIPDAYYREDLAKHGITLPAPGEYGVAMVFLPKEIASRLACEQELERSVRADLEHFRTMAEHYAKQIAVWNRPTKRVKAKNSRRVSR